MGRKQLLLSTAILLAAVLSAEAQEKGTRDNPRQVAPGITMAPGSAKPVQAKAEPVKVETSKSATTTYGPPVAPASSVEAQVEAPKPSQPPVTVKSAEKPAPIPGRSETTRPVAASPMATPKPVEVVITAAPAKPQEKIAEAPREQVRTVSNPRPPRELRVGDRIPDDVQLYDRPARSQQATRQAPIRVGDRVPDEAPLYGSRREVMR